MNKKATFRNDQGRTIRPNKAEMKAIRNCSGYNGDGCYMIVHLTGERGTRIYKAVCGNWMDASLRDVPELKNMAFRNRI